MKQGIFFLFFSKLIMWTDSVWCRKQGRPALLWLSASAEPQSSSWPWLTTPSSALTKVWWTHRHGAFFFHGSSVSAACFSHDFIVSESYHCVMICLSDTKQLVSWMRGHEGAVSSISVHSSGRYAISTSLDTAQLWDLDTFQRKRKLNIRQSVGIQRVNMTDQIINK